MYPQVPFRAKVRIWPWFVLVVVGLGVLDDAGYLDLAAAAATTNQAHSLQVHRPKATNVARPSRAARDDIPARYLRLYRQAGAGERWGGYPAWAVLAGIGKVESDHGRSRAPGVRSGVNRFGCCAGPMQFNLRNGPPSTWDTWGRGDVYDPADAIPAAARKLRGDGAARNLDAALLAYNHSSSYVAGVKALARSYQH